jgi:hypothetical protein
MLLRAGLRLVRSVAQHIKFAARGAIGWVAFGISKFETGNAILSSVPGEGAPEQLGPRVVVFNHFDGQGRIRDHTRAYIDALRLEGMDIVFVTNSGHLAPSDLSWIRSRAARVLIRRNLGYDFAAWRDAMSECGLPSSDTRLLLIANDSVYGPFRPLGSLLDQMDFSKADVWGVTDSWQHRFHLQSYFVAFGPVALRSAAFANFWASVRMVRSKWWIVKHYEIELTRAFITAGMRCMAVFPYTAAVEALREQVAEEEALTDMEVEEADARASDVLVVGRHHSRSMSRRDPFAEASRANVGRILRAALERVPLNPTADLWQILIDQGCPFLKRELVRDNPSRVPGVAAWRSVVGAIEGYDPDVIQRDLERSLKNSSP